MKALVDSFGRPHDYLRISVTDKCNLRCFYCMPDEPCFMKANELMTGEEIVGMAKMFVEQMGVRKIRLTGGEPFVRKDIEFLLRELSKLGVPVAITTNGILLDKHIPLLKEVGISSVNISLDSLEPNKFSRITKRDLFDKVRGNIDKAAAAGLPVKMNVVVMRGVNEEEVIEFAKLTIDNPIAVRFIEFMPFHSNNWEWDKVVPANEIVSKIDNLLSLEKIDDDPNHTSRNFRISGAKGSLGVISSITNPFCHGCNRIRLTADGKIRNCLFGQEEWDVLAAYREGKVIAEVVQSALDSKHKQRGGLPEFEDQEKLLKDLSERTMVRIGG